MSKKKPAITDADVKAMCVQVGKGLSILSACALVGINEKTLGKLIDGDDPKRPDWRAWKDKAKAEYVLHWIDQMEQAYAAEKGTHKVKACEVMLHAMDPRFRKDKQFLGGNTTIVMHVGSPEDVKRVVDSALVQHVLPEAPTGDERA